MSSAAEFLPDSRSLKALRQAAETGRGCELYKDATQVVLRLRDHDEREAEIAGFVADLEGVATALQGAAR